MRMIVKAALSAFGLFVIGDAEAQSVNKCQSVMRIDTIYDVSKGNQSYEYFITISNNTNAPVTADITFGVMPSDVYLSAPRIANMTTRAWGHQTIRIGQGTNSNIRALILAQDLIPMSNARPYVSINNCRTG